MSLQQDDKLHNLLSSLKPIEPRAGLEQEIFRRIQQEPKQEPPIHSRMPKWLVPTAAVASFVGCLVVLGGFMLHVNPGVLQQSIGSAANSMPAVENSSASEKSSVADKGKNTTSKDAISDSAKHAPASGSAQSRSLDTANPAALQAKMELTQGLLVTLSAPDTRQDQSSTYQSPGFLSPDDFKRILTELNDAGAQWAAVNGVPVAAADALEWKDNALYVRGSRLQAPYQVSVSGDPSKLRASIEQKGSYISSLQSASRLSLSIQTVGNSK